jgi:polar amino acid transport system permease protein
MDKVKSDSLLSKPWFNLAAFSLIAMLFYVIDLRGGGFVHLLAPVVGVEEDVGDFGRFLLGTAVGLGFVANLHILKRLTLRIQIPIIWFELLLLFLSFFYSFGLDYGFIQKKIGFMITQGAVTTLYISAISIAIAFVLALIGAIAKLSSNPFAFAFASFYTSFFRGLPLLMQVYLLYLGLPQLGWVIGAVPSGIIALSLCYGAYMTEIFRAGILSIDRGQWEAARGLALTSTQTMRFVVLPQAMRVIIPPTGNQFIAMLKDSSLVSVLGVWELMFLARTQGQIEFKHLEMLITAALIYWSLSMVLEFIQASIERKFKESI